MNPARTLVRDLFKAGMPAWNVIATSRTADAVVKPTAVLWVSQLARQNIGRRAVVSTVDLWLLPPSTLAPDALEDEADAMLAEAVALIEAHKALVWTEATRSALDDFHGWKLSLTLAHQIVPTT